MIAFFYFLLDFGDLLFMRRWYSSCALLRSQLVINSQNRLQNQSKYGQDGEFSDWTVYEDVLTFTEDGWYYIEAYAVAEGMLPSDPIASVFIVSLDPDSGLSEMATGKQVASVRYYNMTGQEMQQANGLTIVVTTFADGSTSAVKVIK